MKQLLKKKFIISLWLVVVICSILFLICPVLATNVDDFWGGSTERENFKTQSKLGDVDLKVAIANIIGLILGFLGFVAVIIILYGGFMWMTAAGNEDKVSKAKQLLIAGVIGLAIIIASYGIAVFVLKSLLEATTGTPQP